MSQQSQRSAAHGLLFGCLAYGMWGFLPLFWRQLSHVGAWEQLAQQIIWGWFCFAGLVVASGRRRQVLEVFGNRRVRRRLALAAVFLATNWFAYVYAVLAERVLDASLGYFINPIVSVALGRLVLGERMRPAQSAAVSVAVAGIAVAAWQAGGVPWVSAVIATSFGLYGLIRKTTTVEPAVGSAFEASVLLPAGLCFTAWNWQSGLGEFGHGTWGSHALLLTTGLVSALPMWAFVNAAARLRLTTLGLLQYLAPSLQFAVATVVFGEPISTLKLAAFGLVWVALVIFAIDALRARNPT